MTATSDTVAFLANSENRVAVLDALTATPQTRYELLERLDVSRVTLARVLRDLEAHHWIERTGHTYATTPLGEWVYYEFTDLLDVLAAEHRFRNVMPWFPTEAVGFEVQWIRDAEIVRPTACDPTAPIRRTLEQLRAGTRLRVLSTQVTPSFFDSISDPVHVEETKLEAVATPAVYETIEADSEMASAFRDLRAVPTRTFFVAESLPLILHVVDDNVSIGLTDDDGTPRAGVFSDSDAVLAWAIETFETCRDAAEPLERPTAVP